MEIDENTGLVRVPEDMFWRITSSDFYGETLYTLHLVRRFSWKAEESRQYWFGDKIVTRYQEETVSKKKLYRRIVQDINQEVPEGYKAIDTYILGNGNKGGRQQFILSNVEPSPIVFFRKSVEMWTEYLENQHLQGLEEDARLDRKKESEKYTGDYPPRRFNLR